MNNNYINYNKDKGIPKTIFIIYRWLQKIGLLVLILVFTIIVTIVRPRFIGVSNILNIMKQIVPVGIVALGQFFVIVSAGIDLSIGNGAALSAIITGVVFGTTKNIFLSILMGFSSGFLLGCFNGFFVSKGKVPPFVVTLATFSITAGLGGIIIAGKIIFLKHGFFDFVGRGSLLGIPISFLLLMIIYIFGYVFYNNMKYGSYIISVGDNEESARFVGLNVDRIKMLVYIISGSLVGIAGIVLGSRLAIVQPGLGGITLLLDAITAVILGGTRLSGGKGTIQGVFGGVVFIGIINNSLNILNIPAIYYDVFKGLVIIFALFLGWFVNKKRERRIISKNKFKEVNRII